MLFRADATGCGGASGGLALAVPMRWHPGAVRARVVEREKRGCAGGAPCRCPVTGGADAQATPPRNLLWRS